MGGGGNPGGVCQFVCCYTYVSEGEFWSHGVKEGKIVERHKYMVVFHL